MTRIIAILLLMFPICAIAQSVPSVDPTGVFLEENIDGTVDTTEIDASPRSAPLKVLLKANPSGLEGYGTPRYEWKIWNNDDPSTILIHRTDEDVEHTFTQSGSYTAQLYVTFYNADGSIYYEFPEEGEDPKSIVFSISTSILEFPNAISPNKDGFNDELKPKDGYQSIVEFHAYIFNRWGQKLFEWTNPAEGWDGNYNGNPVKEGVYFVVVKARGADGIVYNIRKDVNLLRGFTKTE